MKEMMEDLGWWNFGQRDQNGFGRSRIEGCSSEGSF